MSMLLTDESVSMLLTKESPSSLLLVEKLVGVVQSSINNKLQRRRRPTKDPTDAVSMSNVLELQTTFESLKSDKVSLTQYTLSKSDLIYGQELLKSKR
ncbi:hypothetical protein Tco_1000544 [Tanacetum coccineum]